MNIERLRQLCLRKPGATEETPFGPETLVFKVGGKIFALADIDLFNGVNLKCDPERAVELREEHGGITPGYHMNKRHWNTVSTDGSVKDVLIEELLAHSYALVVASLPKKVQASLQPEA
ncbi:MAG TPA: MmcQ/YjbR family DNA-binding protein [Flavobacteriales bacterium]|nr:MmcQ/YjbR family DNA-binding protein [Flavobacteriales bacterium]HRP81539.1 MmcQ/YjbR family DNA-binding protein [Flavobacteriales bacterium]HRQ86038.1 MmcQ/YjbR family DNA-binding protein [Flavobacteriales bacterium]